MPNFYKVKTKLLVNLQLTCFDTSFFFFKLLPVYNNSLFRSFVLPRPNCQSRSCLICWIKWTAKSRRWRSSWQPKSSDRNNPPSLPVKTACRHDSTLLIHSQNITQGNRFYFYSYLLQIVFFCKCIKLRDEWICQFICNVQFIQIVWWYFCD